MFQFFGGKKKHTNGGHAESSQPPIQGYIPDDFVILNPPQEPLRTENAPLYPPVNMAGMPAIPTALPRKDVHFLQDVPFKISKEFSSQSNNDIMAMHISEIMAYCTRRMQMDNLDYDFAVEKSVLLES